MPRVSTQKPGADERLQEVCVERVRFSAALPSLVLENMFSISDRAEPGPWLGVCNTAWQRAKPMLLLIILLVVLLFGGGGYYYGRGAGWGAPHYGGGLLSLVVIILLVLYLTGNLGAGPR